MGPNHSGGASRGLFHFVLTNDHDEVWDEGEGSEKAPIAKDKFCAGRQTLAVQQRPDGGGRRMEGRGV